MSRLVAAFVAAVLLSAGFASAASITDHYAIAEQVTQLGPEKFKFEYTVKNLDQQDPNNTCTGLDGFLVYVPASAIISDVSVPGSYHGAPGHWQYTAGPASSLWWGMEEASVYPAGTSAIFSFVADHVKVGQADAQLTTYWATFDPRPAFEATHLNPAAGTWYSQYDARIAGPVAVPLPAAAWTGLGLLGALATVRKLRRR